MQNNNPCGWEPFPEREIKATYSKATFKFVDVMPRDEDRELDTIYICEKDINEVVDRIFANKDIYPE